MNALFAANIAMLVLCIIICLILLLFVLTSGHRKERLTQIFVVIVCCHIPLMMVDVLIFVFKDSDDPLGNIVLRMLFFFSFMLGSILLILFTRYILTYIQLKTPISQNTAYVSHAAIAVCIVNIVFIILTQWSGLYYTIDKRGVFHYGNLYLLSQILAAVCMLLNAGVVVAHRKGMATREFLFLMSYLALPIMAVVIQNIIKGINASVSVAITLTILIFYAGIQSEVQNHIKKNETEARIAVMLSQIQPHFIYNSLTVIKQLCDEDPKTAGETVVEFSDYLRGNLDTLNQYAPIPFRQELKHTGVYLSIEKKRFGDKLNIVYDVDYGDFTLPSLTLQPIVENAVKHGVTQKKHGGTIIIKTTETNTHAVITVSDDGVGFDSENPISNGRNRIGIENVRSRLSTMCGGTLEIESQPGIGTTAVITIPKENEM